MPWLMDRVEDWLSEPFPVPRQVRGWPHLRLVLGGAPQPGSRPGRADRAANGCCLDLGWGQCCGLPPPPVHLRLSLEMTSSGSPTGRSGRARATAAHLGGGHGAQDLLGVVVRADGDGLALSEVSRLDLSRVLTGAEDLDDDAPVGEHAR